ncbi:polynucleotide 5'-hydroxyl-kinase NOL9 isoform X1 [Helicoverpa zea]|uniref:polynucleotide 5'-hydroxyl-kinase NOL9 isoform X1 n=1 Tax=Helicoverpa zea TaxID=7113 RepID=UPI001F566A2B|nr:polynucleotide 5'-hydroxyl-kinase NOL9 isoform X1 [Helicoverpa zea]
MEFFEKAHVSKKQSSKRDSKSEEMVKKQLKQMLEGYKKSDNELIKHSSVAVESHRRTEDSASVSGFSDLDLTSSGGEEDLCRPSTSKSVNMTSNTDFSDDQSKLSESNQDSDSEFYQNSDSNNKAASDSAPSIESVSENIELSDSSVDMSFLEGLQVTSSESNSDDNEIFDPDGALASKILDKLIKREIKKQDKGGIKRKSEEDPQKKKSLKEDIQTKKDIEDQDSDSNVVTLKDLNIMDDDDGDENISDSNTAQNTASATESSPFVSITVKDMPEQKLSDIVDDYKHPTVKQIQDIVHCANYTDLFSTDGDMAVDDTASLIPETGDEDVEELKDDDDDADESTETVCKVSSSADDDTTLVTEIDMENDLEEEAVKPIKVYSGRNCYILVLKHPAELYINGKLKVKPIGGTVEVFGHILKEEVDLYAPNNNFAQCLRTIETPNNYYGMFRKLTSEGLLVRHAEEIVTTLGLYDGIISLSKLNDLKMEFVENNANMDLFSKCNQSHASLRAISAELGCSFMLRQPWRYFEENESWDQAINCGFEKNSRGIVCGGKGLGKSTFLRYFINRMLANGPVLVIDLDPGQPEFTVAGNVSVTIVDKPLLGPNYTHLKKPEMTLNIGMISTMDNVDRFVSAINKLFMHCLSHGEYSSMPWIINTMGMCTQMGLKFLLLTIMKAQPTFLLQIDSKVAKKRFDTHLKPEAVREMFGNYQHERFFRNVEIPKLDYTFILTKHVEGADKHNTACSPKELRYLNFLAYFGELINIHKGALLLAIKPYELSLSDLNVITNVKVANEAVLKVINGKIVALCQLGTADKGKVFTLDDNTVLCHGNGLVRGVDFERETLYILTPALVEHLCVVDTLLYADWAPELRGPERQLPDGMAVPYRSPANYMQKQFMQAPRRRFNPLQLLKMSRNT